MRWFIYLAVFGAGFALGAWRAGSPKRSLVGAASLLPLAILLLAGLAAFVILIQRPRGGGDMSDLATLSIAVISVGLALLAFAGGLFGAWYRRAGKGRS